MLTSRGSISLICHLCGQGQGNVIQEKKLKKKILNQKVNLGQLNDIKPKYKNRLYFYILAVNKWKALWVVAFKCRVIGESVC